MQSYIYVNEDTLDPPDDTIDQTSSIDIHAYIDLRAWGSKECTEQRDHTTQV